MTNFNFLPFSKQTTTLQADSKEFIVYLNYLIHQIKPYISLGKYYDAIKHHMRQTNNFYQALVQIENRYHVIVQACRETMIQLINNPDRGKIPDVIVYCKAYALLYQQQSISLPDIFGCHHSSPNAHIEIYLNQLKNLCQQGNLIYADYRQQRYIWAKTLANYPWLTKFVKLYKLLVDQKLISYNNSNKHFIENSNTQLSHQQQNDFFQQFAEIARGKDATYNDWRASSPSNTYSRHIYKEGRHPFEMLLDNYLMQYRPIFTSNQGIGWNMEKPQVNGARESINPNHPPPDDPDYSHFNISLKIKKQQIQITSYTEAYYNQIGLRLSIAEYSFRCRQNIQSLTHVLYSAIFYLDFWLQINYNLQLCTKEAIQQQSLSLQNRYKQHQTEDDKDFIQSQIRVIPTMLNGMLPELNAHCTPLNATACQVFTKLQAEAPGIINTYQHFISDANKACEFIIKLCKALFPEYNFDRC